MMQSRTRTPDSRKTVVGGRGATRIDKRRAYNIISNRIICMYSIGTARCILRLFDAVSCDAIGITNAYEQRAVAGERD